MPCYSARPPKLNPSHIPSGIDARMKPPSIKLMSTRNATCGMQHAAWHTAMERLLPAASSPSELRLPVTAPCPAALFTLHNRGALRRSAAEPRRTRTEPCMLIIDRTAVLTAVVQCVGPVSSAPAAELATGRTRGRSRNRPSLKPSHGMRTARPINASLAVVCPSLNTTTPRQPPRHPMPIPRHSRHAPAHSVGACEHAVDTW
jgi:hypothetical protein